MYLNILTVLSKFMRLSKISYAFILFSFIVICLDMITTFYALKLPYLMEYNLNYSYFREITVLIFWGICIGIVNYCSNELSLMLSSIMILYVGYYGVINNLYWIALFTW